MKVKVISVYVTCKDEKEAKKIGEAVVGERLAACANVHKSYSIYRWKGKIERYDEWVLVLKSKRSKYKELEKRVKSLHSYKVPAILAFPIEGVLKEYENWVLKELK